MISSVHSKRNYLALILFDVFVVLACFVTSYALRFGVLELNRLLPLLMDGRVLLVAGLVVLFNFIFDLYEIKYWINSLFSPLRIVLSTAMVAGSVSIWIYLIAAESIDFMGRGVLLSALGGYLVLSLAYRWVIQYSNERRVRDSLWLVLGSEEYQAEFEKEYKQSSCDFKYEWINSADTHVLDKLQDRIRSNAPTGVVVCGELPSAWAPVLMFAKFQGLKIFDFQFFYERVWGKVAVRFLSPGWFIFNHGFTIVHEKLSLRIKMILDFIGASFLLLCTFPVIFLAALAVCLDSRGGAFYKQERVGLGGKTFTIYKLRSMRMDAEAQGAQWAQKQDNRVTRIGRFLRLTRIDELPQLINVIRGDMSFVGPRPERPEFTSMLEKQIPYYNLRHLVKPGLTGWAQVAFSYGSSNEDSLQKLQYELFYIKNHSIWIDMLIVFKTFMVVLFGRGR